MVVLDQQETHPLLILLATCLGIRVLAEILYIVLNSQLLGKRQQTFMGETPTQEIPFLAWKLEEKKEKQTNKQLLLVLKRVFKLQFKLQLMV